MPEKKKGRAGPLETSRRSVRLFQRTGGEPPTVTRFAALAAVMVNSTFDIVPNPLPVSRRTVNQGRRLATTAGARPPPAKPGEVDRDASS